MGEVLPLPSRGAVFLDPRGQGRSLRVSWHGDEGMLVISMWQLGQCRATFRLPAEQVPDLVKALVVGLSDGLVEQRMATQRATQAQAAPVQPVPATERPLPPSWGGPPVPQGADEPGIPIDGPTVPTDGPTAVADAPVALADPPKPIEAASASPPSAVTGAHPHPAVPPLIFLAPPDAPSNLG
jgi:hypothetical protein